MAKKFQELRDKLRTCPKCGVEMTPGKAIANTIVAGAPDFIGDGSDDRCQTMHYGGPGKLVDCLKCPQCGHSVGGKDGDG